MLVDSSNSAAGSAVTGAIRQAARPPGRASNIYWRRRRSSSGLNPQAGASTSSARGLFQFIEQTWLGTMKQAGPSLGYGQYADAITKNASGTIRSEGSGDAQRNSQAAQRSDRERGDGRRLHPGQCGIVVGATRPHAERGRTLYRAFSRRRRRGAPDLGRCAPIRMPAPRVIFRMPRSANPSIFYDRATGAPRSLAQVRDVLTARYDVRGAHRQQRAWRRPAGVDTAMLRPIPPMPIPSVSRLRRLPRQPVSSAAATVPTRPA